MPKTRNSATEYGIFLNIFCREEYIFSFKKLIDAFDRGIGPGDENAVFKKIRVKYIIP